MKAILQSLTAAANVRQGAHMSLNVFLFVNIIQSKHGASGTYVVMASGGLSAAFHDGPGSRCSSVCLMLF